RLDRQAVDLVHVQLRLDLVDLGVHVLLGLRRAEPRPLERVDLVRLRQRRLVALLVLLGEALDRAGAVREDVVDRLVLRDLVLDRLRERERPAVAKLERPLVAGCVRPGRHGGGERERGDDSSDCQDDDARTPATQAWPDSCAPHLLPSLWLDRPARRRPRRGAASRVSRAAGAASIATGNDSRSLVLTPTTPSRCGIRPRPPRPPRCRDPARSAGTSSPRRGRTARARGRAASGCGAASARRACTPGS